MFTNRFDQTDGVADMTQEAIDAFLAEPRDAVLSVVLASGRVIGTPVWFRWVDGVVRFQSPTTSAKTTALRASGRASLCVHDQPLPLARYVTLEGPVVEVEFELDADIGSAARHYLGDGAEKFMRGTEQALASGRKWASFELTPSTIIARTQSLG
jgi:pyridoxine/pyridoxamine 5'-phosphate oxidase